MKKYILGVVLSLGILASPTFTQAASLTDAQIQSILSLLSVFGADSATVASVNSALTGTTPTTETTPAFCFKTTSDLTVGSTGSGVSELNQALTLSGVNTNGNTSVFDENVAADVVSFQAKYGIRQTGYVGPMTRGKLKALYGCSTSPRTGEFCGGIRGLLCAAEYSCKLDGQYPDAGGTCVKTDSVRPLPPPTSSRIPSTTPVPTSINVLYPTAGMTVTKGQSVTIAWESLGSSANYYVISRSTGGKGAIGTYSASQAHCDAASKCYVSWVPDFNDPNVTIFIQDTPSLLSGTSGSFAIVSPSSTQPSIHLSVSSGNQINDSSISVNVGGTFTISGTPQNLQGMSYYSGNGYPTSGYYNRAYFFDQNFSNNNSCGNNDASPTGVWTMTCTAKVSGSSSFYVEIYANGQIYRSNQVTVTIPNTTTLTPTITVVSPNGGEILTPGQTYTIRWSSQNIPSGARIRITIMNGTRGTNADPNTTIVTNLPANATSYTWTVSQNTNNWGIGMASPLRKLVNLLARTTYAGSDQYMIGIIVDNPAGETAYDRSDNSFTITTSTLTTTSTIPNISYINPTTISAGSTVYVYGSNLYGNPFSLDGNFGLYGVNYPDTSGNSFSFVVPSNMSAGIHTLHVAQKASSAPGNSVTFTVVATPASTPTMTITSPNGGEVLMIGQTKRITWNSSGINNVHIAYLNGGGFSPDGGFTGLIANSAPNTGYYDWNVHNLPSTQTKIRIFGNTIGSNGGTTTIIDDSDGFFIVTSSTSSPLGLGGGVNQMAGVASAVSELTSGNQSQTSFVYVWNRDLQIGSPYFADVIALQTALAHEGIYAGDISGGFYNTTFVAVKAFQQKYGIKVTGYVGHATRAKLNSLYST